MLFSFINSICSFAFGFSTASQPMTKNDNMLAGSSAKEGFPDSSSDTDINTLFSYNGRRLPVYFLSHGGPTFLYPSSSPGADIGAWKTTATLGRYIKETIKPNFIIVVSAHWESMGSNVIHVSVPQSVSKLGVDAPLGFLQRHAHSHGQREHLGPIENKLIYDFSGFPRELYQEKFRTKSSLALATNIVDELNNSGTGIRASLSQRGIDHGVWVPFKVAFGAADSNSQWDLDIPVVQVSLAGSDDFDIHYNLGKTLAKYRDLGGLPIVSGMSVHNLGDMYTSLMSGTEMPYVKRFTDTLNGILLKEENAGKKLELLKRLKSDPELKKLLWAAHPTLEHFLPIVVGLGAAEGLEGKGKYTVKELYNNRSLSLGWGIYQYGDY